MYNIGESDVEANVQQSKPHSVSIKKNRRGTDGSSDTSDLPEKTDVGGTSVYCQPYAPLQSAADVPFAITIDSEIETNLMRLYKLGYTFDIQAITNVLNQCGGDFETAEAILQAQYGSPSPDSDTYNNASDGCGADWQDNTSDDLPDLVAPDMIQDGEWPNGSSWMYSQFDHHIREDHPVTKLYLEYEYWERGECERFLRRQLWKLADVTLKWLHPLWTLHQVFSFLVVPETGLLPKWFHNPMSMAKNRAREEWVSLTTEPMIQFTPIAIPRTSHIDYPVEIRGFFEAPSNSLYTGGTFNIRILLPCNFPQNPPVVKFDTPIFHPSYDTDGEFLLGATMWNKKITIRQVVNHLSSRLLLDEVSSMNTGGNTDIVNMWRSDRMRFDLTAATWTQKLAT